jgi:hypothetical protein
LIQRFGLHPEYLATEALGFILDRSPACRDATRDVAVACGATVDKTLVYRTQQVDEAGARPDVIGSPPGARPHVILEGKFWAGLTPNQPGGYLAELGSSQPGILFMVVPSERMAALWPEVRQRCQPHLLVSVDDAIPADDLIATRLTDGHVLAMVSWRLLLARMAVAAEAAHETDVREDITQLQSLCDVQDRGAFLPLRLDEVTDQTVPRRVLGYHALVNDIRQQAIDAGLASKDGLRWGGGFPKRHGAYLGLGQWGVLLAVALDLWGDHGYGPLRLCFQDWWRPEGATNWVGHVPFNEIARQLSPLAVSAQRDGLLGPIMLVPSDGRPVVALPLATGVEQHHIVAGVIDQLRRVHELLSTIVLPAPPAASLSPAELPDNQQDIQSFDA